jgi:CubicO group peptidase (beta-lactamase class C family)
MGLAAVAALVLGAVPTTAAPTPPAVTTAQANGIAQVVEGQMKRRGIPGAQVTVIRGGRIVYARSFGVADRETGAAATDATLFTLNSATKSFTGVAILQLVQDGRLSLDDPIGRHVADLPPAWQPVTVRQLLAHVSGLPDIVVPPTGQGTGSLVGGGDQATAWDAVRALPVEAPPGTRYRYNQTNYVLLGKLIDRLAGRPFTAEMRARQFVPAGMAHVAFGGTRDILPGRTRIYRYAGGAVDGVPGNGALEHAFDEFEPFLRTAGGLNASATDVARWLVALQDGSLLRAGTLKALWTPARFTDGRATPWAMGWPIQDHGGHRVAAGIGGRRTAFFVYPDDDLAVVVLTNLAGANPEAFVDEIAGQFLPDLLARNGGALALPLKRLRSALVRDGFATAPAAYARLKAADPTYVLDEGALNAWGGALVESGRAADAVAIFALAVQLYPQSANAHDSLAEGYEAARRPADAVASYRRSLALDPGNTHASDRLRALGATP